MSTRQFVFFHKGFLPKKTSNDIFVAKGIAKAAFPVRRQLYA